MTRSASTWTTAACDALVAALLAPACAACAAPLSRPSAGAVCAACWQRIPPLLPPLCAACGDALASWRTCAAVDGPCPRCRRRRTIISRTRAVGCYEGSLRAIVHALKYGGRRSLAPRLSALMRETAADLLAGADAVVPVPLHPLRRLTRGFNQATALARGLGLPVLHALRRTRHTPMQADLPAGRRHGNVRGAFAAARRPRVRGACLVLVDDVSTTGATLEACARALRAAGAREVRAVIAARAVARAR